MNSLKKLSTFVVFFLVLFAVGPTRQHEVHGNEDQVRAFERVERIKLWSLIDVGRLPDEQLSNFARKTS